jgi:hypothetical protein
MRNADADDEIGEDGVGALVAALRAGPPGEGDAGMKVLILSDLAARSVADLVELGAAPGRHVLPEAIRRTLLENDSVQVAMPISQAREIADLVEAGRMRREAGATGGAGFRLH